MCITMAANMDRNELKYAAFINEKIEKAGGLVKFQHLTGHLSQLDMSVRQTVGASPGDLRKFLDKHKGLFTINSEGFVSIKKTPEAATEIKNQKERVVTNSSRNDSDSLFPPIITDAPGIVIKVLPTFGFISIKNPVKTQVYFTPSCVADDKFKIGDDSGRLLTDIDDMLPGKKVRLNAKRANTSAEAKYRATRVWTPPNVENEVLVPNGFHPKVPKDGLYDPVSIEGSGKVQNVFEQFGFIINDNSSENIFFHKSKVCNVQNIMNLAKVFSPGDSVEFKAIRSKKQDLKVKWEASKVWIKKAGKTNLFKTDDSSGVGLSECDSQSQKSSKKGPIAKNIEPKHRQLLDAQLGKIYPHSDGVVIKFGKNDSELADADSCPFYLHGEKVQDVCWEFSDGDNVYFEGIKIKSAPGWKALFAWVGVKPNIVLPMHVGDFTEFSDDDSVSLHENFVPDLKSRVIRPSQFSKQAKRDHRSTTPNNKSRTFVPSPALSQVSNSSSRSYPKSHTSVDKDFDLLSDDTVSSVSADSKSQGSVHPRRRNRRSKFHSKPIKKANSRSSLTDDATLESEDSYTNQDTREFNHSRFCREDVGSNILSRATLKPSVSCESLDFETSLKPSTSSESLDFRKCLQPNPGLYKNWGDTPFPGEENNETSLTNEEITSLSNEEQLKDSYSDNKLENESGPSPMKSPKPEIFHSDDEFCDAVQTTEDIDKEVKYEEPEDFESENKRNLLKEMSNSDGAADKEAYSKPYVKFFRDLEGKILKVFCKFAEIEHGLLNKPVSVLWNDLYHNGVPVADKFDDMKEVIKPGQTIKFNCIEIIDDAGSCWQKITVAWKGQKPKVKEMTPREYINQNFLRISVPESEIDSCYQDTDSQITGLNITTESEPTAAAPPRKFLAVAAYSDDEEEESNESVKVEDTKASHLDSVRIIHEEKVVNCEEEDLAVAISQMILNFAESEIDIKALSEDIISLVRRRNGMANDVELPSTSTVSTEVIVHNKECQACLSDDFSLPLMAKGELINSETQTIITGDVIAQSLFTISVQHLQ